MPLEKFNSLQTAAVLTPGLSMEPIAMEEGFYEQLNTKFNQFKGHTLMSVHEFSENWSVWEKHPKGDEMVMLLSGRATMVIHKDSGEERCELAESGSYVIVPQNHWHTAQTTELTRMLFFTPGEATEHRND